MMQLRNSSQQQIKEEIKRVHEINEIIHPNFATRLGSLNLNLHLDYLLKQSDTRPLDNVAKQAVFNLLPPIVQHLASSTHFDLIPTKVTKFNGSDLDDEHLRRRLARSKVPRINHGREMHVILQGKGRFELKVARGGNVSLVVEAGDVLYIAPTTEHSFFLELDEGDVPSESFMFASFHEQEFDRFHKRVEYLPSSSSSSSS